MKASHLIHLVLFGLKSIVFRWEKPILGTIIVTDYCNLNCKHCAVNNINKIMHSFESIEKEMQHLFEEGIRILFLSGGETMLWHDREYNIKDLIARGREIGFYIINIVTNGTVHLQLPEADVVFLSIDGMRNTHNAIRGDVFDTVMKNVVESRGTNICVYSAINSLNCHQVKDLCELVDRTPQLNSISFNFHTPYRLTEELCLSLQEREKAVEDIKEMIARGFPVFNLPSTLDTFLENTWKRPCKQCIVSENGIRYDCGRCSEIEGLCENCGYLFAVEFSQLFRGNIPAIKDMFKIYTKYV